MKSDQAFASALKGAAYFKKHTELMSLSAGQPLTLAYGFSASCTILCKPIYFTGGS